MRNILIILFIAPLLSSAQEGIRFEHGKTWQQIVEKAKKEKKYIFMDAFTTWCAPCKYMSANVFTQPAVGEIFNKNYVNVKVQLDSTAKDNEEVKKWYADAHRILNQYNVKVFPTFLFFDYNGKIVHRFIGSSEAAEFAKKGQDAADPNNQYYVLLNKYRKGRPDAALLKKLAYAAADAYENENARRVSGQYLAKQKDYFTKENMEFIERFTQSSLDKGFNIMVQNEATFNTAKGDLSATSKIIDIIRQEMIFTPIMASKQQPEWTSISQSVIRKYPKHGNEAVSGAKVVYYQRMHDWTNFQTVVQQYMKDFGEKASVDELNNYAWAVFENCKDVACVQSALEWSKSSMKGGEDATYIDTYANLLYKIGKTVEALEWENKALALADESEKQGIAATIDKMKKGEKTWRD